MATDLHDCITSLKDELISGKLQQYDAIFVKLLAGASTKLIFSELLPMEHLVSHRKQIVQTEVV